MRTFSERLRRAPLRRRLYGFSRFTRCRRHAADARRHACRRYEFAADAADYFRRHAVAADD